MLSADGNEQDPRRALPAVDALTKRALRADAGLPEPVVVSHARRELDRARETAAGGGFAPEPDELLRAVLSGARRTLSDSPRPLINATGVIIHTNLGRAPLSDRAIAAARAAAAGYSDLEFEVEEGIRGSRRSHVESLLRELAGAEAALVVNNNAGAVLLCLSVMARGREVIVSRGESVEIGGAFRIPDILAQSGARLVDVGTTNRTRSSDYEAAIGPETALLLKVHRSNFRVVGFTEETPAGDLCELGKRFSIPVMNDLGSGTFLDTSKFGLEHEPAVQESVAVGVALTTFSGDKLLGGPQAGLIVGRRELVDTLASHPLARALRPDKMCLAALRATLIHYAAGEAIERIPVWRMIATRPEDARRRARSWAKSLPDRYPREIAARASAVGGGSLPGQSLPTYALGIGPAPETSVEQVAAKLRAFETPVIGRVENGHVWLDPRTVLQGEDRIVARALASL